MSISAQRVINLNNENANLRRTTAVIPQEFLDEAKTYRSFEINPALQSAENVSVGDFVALQLFEKSNFTAEINNISTDVNGNITLTLKLPDYPMALGFITTNTAGNSLFSVSIPEYGQTFSSRGNTGLQTKFLIEFKEGVELRSTEKEIPTFTPVSVDGSDFSQETSQNQLRAVQQISTTCGFHNSNLTDTAPATINVLIVYTPAAAAWAAQFEGGISNTIALAMARTMAVVDNQRNGDQIRIVHSRQIDHTELSNNMSLDLNRLTNTNDGFMDEVHQWRREHNADLVALLGVYHDFGGMAWLLSNAERGNLDRGFSITRVQQASWTYTFIHEIGHNMGMHHERENAGGWRPFSYGLGWHWHGNSGTHFGSVMSYLGRTVPFFSNPNETHDGVPTGTPTANNAQVFRNTKHIIAAYSDRLQYFPDAPTNIVVSNPTYFGATFTWDAVPNASHYSFWFDTDYDWRWYETVEDNFLTFSWSELLSPCTTYEFFIESVNDCGRTSSRRLTFTTNCDFIAPTVVTKDATNITCNSATLNKSITEGTETIIEQGFEWTIPRATNWQVSINGELSELPSAFTDIIFRAFARTENRIVYGDELTFILTATQTQTIDFPEIGTKTLGDADITLPERTSADLTISYQSSDETVATILGNILTIVGIGSAEITATQSGDCTYKPATEVTRTLTVVGPTVGICQVLANQLQIFPNPVRNELFIQSELQIKKVEIYSLTGALMMIENNFVEKISVSALPRGIYLLKVHTDKGVIASKFVKE